jgi:hypothetical protein
MLNSVLRRYTPPTCTLEIAARNSPLSFWTERPVLERLRFQLSFDDPKLSTDLQVRVRGDRTQLEALCETVSTYVQNFLMQSPAELGWVDLISTSDGISAINGFHALVPTSVNSGKSADEPYATPPLQGIREANFVRNGASNAIAPVYSENKPANIAGIELKPRGLLSHELCLGTLATEESGSAVCLNVMQLFDLANALDEYAADVVSLPTWEHSGWLKSPKSWLSIAAVTVVAVGTTTSLLRFVSEMGAPVQTASSTDSAEFSLADQSAAPSTSEPARRLPVGKQFTPPIPLILPPPSPSRTDLPPGRPSTALGAGSATNSSAPRSSTQALPPLPVVPLPRGAQIQIPTQPISSATSLPDSRSDAAARAETDNDAASMQLNPAAQDQNPSGSTARSTVPGTAFDTIPQVAEARTYFQQQWQPPEGLSQTLEYRLTVSADGTIEQITPLGQAAGDYVDRSSIPLIGEPFVSALEAGRNAEIRLVLSPDGRVRTFLESLN